MPGSSSDAWSLYNSSGVTRPKARYSKPGWYMCLSDAVSIVILTLPDLSSGVSRRARLLARIVPPIPPPMIRIFMFTPFVSAYELMLSLQLLDCNVPYARFLARAQVLVPDLFYPLRNVGDRALVGRQDFHLVTNLCHLDPADQLHQRPRAEAASGINHLSFGHRSPQNLCEY